MELGDELGPQQRRAPQARHIAAYVGSNTSREQLFSDPEYARGLGFAGLVVPGPMLSALIEQFLRRELPEWRIERFSVTFRISVIAGEAIELHGVITEVHERADGPRLVCEVVIERDGRERAVTGSATLRHTAERS